MSALIFALRRGCTRKQHVIVQLVEEKLEALNRLMVEIETQLIKAEKNKQSILASAFSGNLLNVVDQLSGISNEIVKTGT